jgi:carotenoid 1,2-hydratase
VSDDRRHALTSIAFIGSVFSPYYFRARGRNRGDAFDHCAMNVALYGAGRAKWAFTEHPREALRRDANSFGIGGSHITWDGTVMTWRIDETTAPVPTRLRGVIRLYPDAATRFALELDPDGLHRWRPIISRGRVEVELERPALRWSGTGYMDANEGSVPLDEGFREWTWLRAHTTDGTTVIYDVVPSNGVPSLHALQLRPSGAVERLPLPVRSPLSFTGWGLKRVAFSDVGSVPGVRSALEDAPFYARCLLDTTLLGERVMAVHESLSLDRFRSPWVRALLPFRMRRSRR